MNRIILYLTVVVLAASFVMAYVPSDPDPSASCESNLATCLSDQQKLLEANKQLTDELANMTAERDRYRALYEETLLENFSVKRLDAFEQHLVEINNHYETNNKTIYEMNQTINNVKIVQWVIVLALVFELALFGFTFFKQRFMLQKTEILFSKINVIINKEEHHKK